MDLANVRLGQCVVTYDVTESTVDHYGVSAVRTWHKGTRIEAKVTLSEFSYAILLKALTGAVSVAGAGMDPIDAMTVGLAPASTELAGASLNLHPENMDDATQDVTIFKAVVIGETKMPFKVDQETVYDVTFLALVDEDKTNGEYLADFGA